MTEKNTLKIVCFGDFFNKFFWPFRFDFLAFSFRADYDEQKFTSTGEISAVLVEFSARRSEFP
ncbi:MAG: hypothetical protein IKT26_02790 [Bacteroidaceae bacterium]|nr:hypothetical protein [Bacteroidaceae bacterium]